MIPAFLIEKYGPRLAALIFWGVITMVVIVGSYFAVRHYFTAGLETQVKVTSGQLGAQAESGHDAVNTIGNVMGNEQATDQVTRENGNAIDNAPGANVAVDPAVRAAGRMSLCRRKSYRDAHPSCMQQPAP